MFLSVFFRIVRLSRCSEVHVVLTLRGHLVLMRVGGCSKFGFLNGKPLLVEILKMYLHCLLGGLKIYLG